MNIISNFSPACPNSSKSLGNALLMDPDLVRPVHSYLAHHNDQYFLLLIQKTEQILTFICLSDDLFYP